MSVPDKVPFPKEMKGFWHRQYIDLQEEGFLAIWRKVKIAMHRLKRLPYVLLIMPLVFISMPVVLVLRLLKPWIWIRFGYFWGNRIGHFVFDVEYYLCERKLGMHPAEAVDIFCYRWGKPANTFFSRMCKRQLRVRNWSEFLFTANRWLPGGSKHEILPALKRVGSRDTRGLFHQTNHQLYFTDEENLQGRSFLTKVGCNEEDKFICLIVRDAAYLSQYFGGNWSYHNYRDSDIDTYAEAALALAEKGYWVLRMGKAVNKSFNNNHPRILDYANSCYREDFLDIWLTANCFFCISTGTGLDEVARVFRRPSVYLNYLPTLDIVTYDHCLMVPKHLLWNDSRKPLTLSEHLTHSYGESEKYVKNKILVRNLSPDEIKQAVLELELKLTGAWQVTEEDMKRQIRFWKIFKENAEFNTYHGRIHPKFQVSSTFLKSNSQWLN